MGHMNRIPSNGNAENKLTMILGHLMRILRDIMSFLISTLQLRELKLHGRIGVAIWVFFMLLALFGPSIAPYPPMERLFDMDGKIRALEPPSIQHLLGTTWQGRDVLSQVLHGARPTLIVGVTAAFIIAFVGVNIGIISGYFGGKVDMVLMRFVDIVFGLPFLPFMIVLVSVLGRSELNVILAISMIAWRTVARVVRSQVLTLRELPYIKAAKVMGAGHFRILYIHIFPNVLPLAILYLAFGIVWSIISHADVNFLGFGDPEGITWGRMIYSAWAAGVMTKAFWWYLPPAILISAVSSAAFFYARAFEEVANPRLKER
jgi:peptide/nickel transport system permease protein